MNDGGHPLSTPSSRCLHSIVAWNVVCSGTADGFRYVICHLLENLVREGCYLYI